MKFEPVLYFSQVDNILELLRSYALSASCALSHISNYGPAIALSEIFNVKDTRGAEGLKLLSIFVQDILFELDVWY
jgi:hypothetical protein